MHFTSLWTYYVLTENHTQGQNDAMGNIFVSEKQEMRKPSMHASPPDGLM